jgi:hypothetical protein
LKGPNVPLLAATLDYSGGVLPEPASFSGAASGAAGASFAAAAFFFRVLAKRRHHLPPL